MPGETGEYRILDSSISADRALLDIADDEFRQRGLLDQRSHDYYDGNQPRPLKLAQGKIDNNVIINDTAQGIDRTIGLAANEFPGNELDENTEQDTPDETYINEVWEKNEDVVILQHAMLEGALTGHVFVRIQPSDDDYDYPRIYCLSGKNIIAHWQADDKSILLWYEIRYDVGKKQYRQDIVNDKFQSGAAQWLIYQYVHDGRKWTLRTDLPENPAIWPYELGPVIDWQHLPNSRSYYGRSELGENLSLLELQNSINKTASDIYRIIRVHAAPRTVATGIRAEEMNVVSGIDNFWAIPDKDARVYNVEMQSNLEATMAFLLLQRDAFRSGMRVVQMVGSPEAYKGVTNLGIKAAFMDMLAKVQQIQRQYGRKFISETDKRFLMLDGRDYDVKPRIVWATPLPTSDLEETQIAQQQIDMGVLSKETAAGDLGRDWQTEQDRLANEGDTAQTALDRQMARGGAFPFDTPQDAARRSMQTTAQEMMRGNNGNN